MGPLGESITYVHVYVHVVRTMQILNHIHVAQNKLITNIQICTHFLWREVVGVA